MKQKKSMHRKMSIKFSFYGLLGLTFVCIFFVLLNQHYNGYIENRVQTVLSDVEMESRIEKHMESLTIFSNINNYTNPEIQDVINQQRRIIESEMEGYNYVNGGFRINVSLSDLIMEKGGSPVRSIILTSWRSGSTFVGDILNSHPANFYHYEPLLDFGIVQVRGPPLAQAAIDNIYALFNCEYHKLQRYLDYGKAHHPWVFNHNTHLWRQCTSHEKICWNPEFVSKFCRLFPFQSMKLVRLRLKIAQILLEDKSLGIRIVLLVRDPRGLLQSRKHREWCPTSPDCSEPARVCSDMVSDYEIAIKLTEKFPQSFKVIRYEDLSLDPLVHAKNLYKFYGLDFHEKVLNFIETHTKNDVGGVSSTFRNSRVAPFHWRNDLDYKEVENIQSVCSTAMRLWGYVLALNESHQKTFNPITNYFLE